MSCTAHETDCPSSHPQFAHASSPACATSQPHSSQRVARRVRRACRPTACQVAQAAAVAGRPRQATAEAAAAATAARAAARDANPDVDPRARDSPLHPAKGVGASALVKAASALGPARRAARAARKHASCLLEREREERRERDEGQKAGGKK